MDKLLKIALLSIMFICVNASANEMIRSHKYKYDVKGNVIEENLYLYDTRGNVVEENKTTYKYDSKGNKIEEHYFLSNGIYGDYTYDLSGEVIGENYWEPIFGSHSNTYEYELKEEESGILFSVYEKKVIFSHRGNFENTKLRFEYNRTGELLAYKTEYDLYGNVLWTEEYDINGNLIEKVIYKEY